MVTEFAGTIWADKSPKVAWTKTFNGLGDDEAWSVQQTKDDGYIIVGSTKPFTSDNTNAWLIKTDSKGNKLWSKIFNGKCGYSVQQTSDGGYIIAGEICYKGKDVYLIKTDSSGNELWRKIFGGLMDDVGRSVQQTSDGGYIIAGETGSYKTGVWKLYLIKTDLKGNLLWERKIGELYYLFGRSVQQTSDGGYIIVARKEGELYLGVCLIKTDLHGNISWEKAFREPAEWTEGYSVCQTNDGGYVIAGRKYTYMGKAGFYLIKTDSGGNVQWERIFRGHSEGRAYSVCQTKDGGYIMAGKIWCGSELPDVRLIKTDLKGNLLWEKIFGGTDQDCAHSVCQTKDGGYIIGGSTSNDVYLIKLKARDLSP